MINLVGFNGPQVNKTTICGMAGGIWVTRTQIAFLDLQDVLKHRETAVFYIVKT